MSYEPPSGAAEYAALSYNKRKTMLFHLAGIIIGKIENENILLNVIL
jgi:hypothetical protein